MNWVCCNNLPLLRLHDDQADFDPQPFVALLLFQWTPCSRTYCSNIQTHTATHTHSHSHIHARTRTHARTHTHIMCNYVSMCVKPYFYVYAVLLHTHNYMTYTDIFNIHYRFTKYKYISVFCILIKIKYKYISVFYVLIKIKYKYISVFCVLIKIK